MGKAHSETLGEPQPSLSLSFLCGKMESAQASRTLQTQRGMPAVSE